MNWYVSKIIFRIVCDVGNHTPQFDEQLCLFSAETELEAFQKARITGINREDSFKNDKQQTVKWEFIDVVELLKINTIQDGMEVYSQINEYDDAIQYISMIKQKAHGIELKAKETVLSINT